jgi:hypothetical protein
MNKFSCQIGLIIASSLFVLSFPLYSIFWVYPHFTKIITFEKEVSAKQIANHISKMLVVDSTNNTITQESITEDFIETLKEAQGDFDLTKIKVFSSLGKVLYSTDDQDIGALNTNPYFKDIISQGKIFSKVVHRDEKTMEEEIVKKDVIETYVPLMRDNHFIGAFEIYYDITYSGHSINTFIAKSRIIILLVSFVLLLCILLISFSTMLYLKKQLKAEKQLQMLKDKVPSLYNVSLDETDE